MANLTNLTTKDGIVEQSNEETISLQLNFVARQYEGGIKKIKRHQEIHLTGKKRHVNRVLQC
jgi:hypothetical protein